MYLKKLYLYTKQRSKEVISMITSTMFKKAHLDLKDPEMPQKYQHMFENMSKKKDL